MLNKVIMIGRVVAAPEFKATLNGTSVANYTLAVERDYGKEKKETDFIDCVCWRGAADFAGKHLEKGTKIAVCGRLETRNWEDKNGNKRKSVEVNVSEHFFCESKGNQGGNTVEIAPGVGVEMDIPDLPFAWGFEESENSDLPF